MAVDQQHMRQMQRRNKKGRRVAGEGTAVPAGAARLAARLVPFVRASYEHTEPAVDDTKLVTGNSQNMGPYEIPAYGYLRHILLIVEATGGALGTGVLAQDFPWNIFEEIKLSDVNGTTIFQLSGYETYLANRFGGYAPPDTAPDSYEGVVTNNINSTIILRVPVEVTARDAYGALANQNAAASYKLSLQLAALSRILSTVGTATAPSVRVRAVLEAWQQPNLEALDRAANMQEPPRHGTTQYWSSFVRNINAGQNTILLPRVGNLIRLLILAFYRTDNGQRDTTVMPDPIQFNWDSRQIFNEPRIYRRALMQERYPQGVALSPGVIVYDFAHDGDGRVGDENRDLWLPTLQATRLEFMGSFGQAGTLRVLTNDIAPAPIAVEHPISGNEG